MTAGSRDIASVVFAGFELRYHAPDQNDHIQRILHHEHRVYEEALLMDCFSRELHRGAVVDVGANIGNHTVVFAKALGRRVIAVEPYPPAIDILQQNLALNGIEPMVRVVTTAAGKNRGRAAIVPPPAGNCGQARLVEAVDGDVEIVPLDELEITGRVALIKIDVEGMEADVLAGARRLIKQSRPLIYVEIQDLCSHARVKKQLARLGYRMLHRFNHTPTYLYRHCGAEQDQLSAILDKLDDLVELKALAVERDARTSRRDQPQEASAETSTGVAKENTGRRQQGAGTGCRLESLGEIVAELSSCRRAFEAIEVAMEEDKAACNKANIESTALLKAMLADLPEKIASAVCTSVSQSLANDRREGREEDRSPRDTHSSSSRKRRRSKQTPDGSNGFSSQPIRRAVATRLSFPVEIGQSLLEVRLPTPVAAGATKRAPDGESNIIPRPRPNRSSSPQKVKARPASSATPVSERTLTEHELVSVIMTTFNSEEFVAAAARNILAQSHKNLELIIVDDASSDGTWRVISQLARTDSRIRPAKMFTNQGTYCCKNYGVTLARGRYVTFQDSDDRSDPDRIRLQLHELKSRSAVACTCNYVRVDARGERVANRGLAERKAIMAVMFDRELVLSRAGYFDSVRISADDEFSRRLAAVFGTERICHVPKPYYLATVREGSLTNNRRTSSNIGSVNASLSDQSYLSAPRREYVRQFMAWHDRIKRGETSPRLPFPLLRRPYPVPRLLLPDPSQGDSFVTASLASIPAREELLRQTTESILPQVDVLNVYLNGYADTPRWLRGDKVQVIHSREYGDLRDNGKFFFLDALLPGYHFTIDDDIVYPTDYVQKCIFKIEQYGRQAIVGLHGVVLATPFERFMSGRTVYHFKQAQEHDRFVHLLGTGTTAYHTDAIKLSVDDFPHPGMADVWLAIAAKRQRVPLVSIERPKNWLIPLAEAEDTSLFAAARRDDAVQTAAIRNAGDWDLASMCNQSKLCREMRLRFSAEELRSRGVDVDLLFAANEMEPPHLLAAHA